MQLRLKNCVNSQTIYIKIMSHNSLIFFFIPRYTIIERDRHLGITFMANQENSNYKATELDRCLWE